MYRIYGHCFQNQFKFFKWLLDEVPRVDRSFFKNSAIRMVLNEDRTITMACLLDSETLVVRTFSGLENKLSSPFSFCLEAKDLERLSNKVSWSTEGVLLDVSGVDGDLVFRFQDKSTLVLDSIGCWEVDRVYNKVKNKGTKIMIFNPRIFFSKLRHVFSSEPTGEYICVRSGERPLAYFSVKAPFLSMSTVKGDYVNATTLGVTAKVDRVSWALNPSHLKMAAKLFRGTKLTMYMNDTTGYVTFESEFKTLLSMPILSTKKLEFRKESEH